MEKTKSIIKISIKNIISNKLRSSLTMLGLVIGIISVILLVGIGSGATSNVTSKVKSLGTGTLTVTINSNADSTLEYSQMDEILNISNVKSVAPYKSVSGTVSRGTTTSKRASILATTPQYMSIMNLTISDGRLLSHIDLNNYSKICLVGSDLAGTLFENTKTKDIVGQSIKIEGEKLNTTFNKENLTYFVQTTGKTKLNLKVTAEDDDAKVYVTGNENLKKGNNKILISVTAENGDVRYYRVFVTNN